MRLIKAKDLRAWRECRRPNQRKWRLPVVVYPLCGNITTDGQPGVLVCLEDCRQEVFNADEPVFEATSLTEVETDGRVKLKPIRRRSR